MESNCNGIGNGDSPEELNGYSDYWEPSQIALNDRFKQLNLESLSPEQKEKVSISPFPKFKKQEFKVLKTSARWYLSYPRTQEIRDEWMKRAGQSEELELLERQAAAMLIQKIGEILKVPQVAINTSIIYMHRFYIFHPIKIFPHDTLASACLLVGAKVSDNYRKLCTVVEAQATAKNLKGKLLQNEVEAMAVDIKAMEDFVVATIAADFQGENPTTIENIYIACKKFALHKSYEDSALRIAKKTLQLTAFCIQYPPTLIAAFCIFKALKMHCHVIADNLDKPWFYYIDDNIQPSMLEEMTYEFDFIEKQVKAWNEKSEQVVLSRQLSQKRGLDGENPKMVKRMSREAESQESASEGRRDKFESERTDTVSIRSHLESCISGTSAGPGYSILKVLRAPRGANILQRALSLPGTSSAMPRNTGMRKEISGISAQTPSQGHSMKKFIKSSIPMKVKPIKQAVEKLSSSEEMARLNELFEVDHGTYSSINPSKKRVAHSREPISSSQQSMRVLRQLPMKQETAVKPRMEPEVYQNIAMEEVVGGFATTAAHSSSEPLISSIADNDDISKQQEALDRPSKKFKKEKKQKEKKQKKKKSKKTKHEKKARQNDESSSESHHIKTFQSVQVNPSSSDTKLNLVESIVQPPIPKVVLKKETNGWKTYSN